MKILSLSPVLSRGQTPVTSDKINVLYQFFIHPVPARANEIRLCLSMNLKNPFIDKVYLLNERIYTEKELGIESAPQVFKDKLIQVSTNGKRLRFSDVYKYIRENEIVGYNAVINADIFFDSTVENLRYSNSHEKKQAFALLRYELDLRDIRQSKIFGPRFDSQDTWIIHSNFTPTVGETKAFQFEFGKPGCDNKMIYLLNILGYEVINDPAFIKTYHVHHSAERNYTASEAVPQPWGAIVPAGYNPVSMLPSIGIDPRIVANKTAGFTQIQFDDNTKLREYISRKINVGENFIIPRIAGIENNYAVYAEMMMRSGAISTDFQNYVNKTVGTMKNNAGIRLTGYDSIAKYSKLYMEAFDGCEMYTAWEPQGDVYRYIAQSHDYIREKYPGKTPLWAFALDIFHYIQSEPWTLALRGKRVLIVSAFEESIQEKIPIRKEIYGIDLFPDCEITTIRPPQTQGTEESQEFDVELSRFCERLDAIRDTYDVALVSAGGYGNLICSHIYKSGKSAVYVGGVLQMYFGINGQRWIRERQDVLRIYMNGSWTRPKDVEKPKNYTNVEGSCYW